MRKILHLVTRFFGAIVAIAPNEESIGRVRSDLNAAEMELWERMPVADQSHSLVVLDRFLSLLPEATRAERAGVLLHDVGKIRSDLGLFARTLATIVGPRTERFKNYHDHERIGADMLLGVGSDPATVAIVRGDGSRDVMVALREADEV